MSEPLRLKLSPYRLANSIERDEALSFYPLWETEDGRLVHAINQAARHPTIGWKRFSCTSEPSVRQRLVTGPDGLFELQRIEVYETLTPIP